jgi:hypothetical protein
MKTSSAKRFHFDYLMFQDKELVQKRVESLQLQVHPRDLKQNDAKQVLYAVMSKWLPLSSTLLGVLAVILLVVYF